ncbi:Amino acid permease [Thalictrum thalictroides]|uniref:Amino acid permease n=1 Tax=Thalictrum thalictroides TaxID=46969 RepID=A0A7J6VHR3_THATH|nr:Amino acid permease [Thalictrum thalictroides]
MDVDDGHIRTGTLWTAIAHAITATIGSGVLSLPWSVAQLGWIFGGFALIFFSIVTYYTAILLCDCYRSPDPVNGRRNSTYKAAVRACLGPREVLLCSIVQYAILWGSLIGYTVTTSTSMATVKRSHCFNDKGKDANCYVSGTLLILLFGAIEVILSQFPNLEKVTLLSYIAALTSFAYSFISSYLCVKKVASHPQLRGSLMNLDMGVGITPATKVFRYFQALGNIAFAYTYNMLLLEIQDTLRSPPSENKTMKKASTFAVGTTTMFYVTLGCMGYLAFGNNAPGNILTGFFEPFWLVDTANISVIIHLIAAYQVYAQPIYSIHEKWLASNFPNTWFFTKVYTLPLPCTSHKFQFTLMKLLLRPAFIIVTTFFALLFPFFNAILGLLGALAFFPLTVYFPVNMYIVQAKIKRGSTTWKFMQSLSMICLAVTLVAGIGSVADVVDRLKQASLFKVEL